jgi:hypothetical protein
MMNNLDNNQIFRDRIKKLFVSIIKELSILKYSEDSSVLRK